ncbi:pyridoxal-phosphate dependent enzyme [Kribbella solani]|uniref:pyridoxal-phosphate dependent enzyme n=1 Tax=Kribbella solani TaxID=236067 RepID=UPI0038D41AB5
MVSQDASASPGTRATAAASGRRVSRRPWATNPTVDSWVASTLAAPALEFHKASRATRPRRWSRCLRLPSRSVRNRCGSRTSPTASACRPSRSSARRGRPTWLSAPGRGRPPARTFAEFSAATALLTRPAPLTVVTATDGNRGRALAHIARLLGLTARIYVPAGLLAGTLKAIGDEGAQVVETSQVCWRSRTASACTCCPGN